MASNILLKVDSEDRLSLTSDRSETLRIWLPIILAATAYLTLMSKTTNLLRDSDTYWHIVVGKWIVEHGAVPHIDLFSFTKHGAHWITSGWLAEVLYFAAFKLAGWPGVAILTATSASIAFFFLTLLLLKRLPNVPVVILVTAGIIMTAHHTLARPLVFVFPLMVLWTNALLQATEQRSRPALANLPLIILWANLHGSFTLGLALIGPFALEAIWTADKADRLKTFLQWFGFGILALCASCITPYGVESIEVTFRILELGPTLSNIGEWKPLDFGAINPVSACLLGGAFYVLYSGLKLPPLRSAVLVAIIFQTLSHIRYVDVCAFVAPFFIAGPLADHLSSSLPQPSRKVLPSAIVVWSALIVFLIATGIVVATADVAPPEPPRAAVEKIRQLKLSRTLNDYYFGGYLIFEGIPTFIDSRAEFYGRDFLKRYVSATSLEDVTDFVKLLDEFKIDSTLLFPSTSAVGLLDQLPGWERAYTDDVAVVHVRRPDIRNTEPSK